MTDGHEHHLFMGHLPLPVGVSIVCAINFMLSCLVIATCTSKGALKVAGLQISEDWQVVLTTWASLGIIPQCFGYTGAIYKIENHLGKYRNYLILTVPLLIALMVLGFKSVPKEETPEADSTAAAAGNKNGFDTKVGGGDMIHSVTTMLVIFAYLLVVIGAGYGSYVLHCAKMFFRRRSETELLQYLDPWKQALVYSQEHRKAEGVGEHDAAPRRFVQKPRSQYQGEGRWLVGDGSAPTAQFPFAHPGMPVLSEDVPRMPA